MVQDNDFRNMELKVQKEMNNEREYKMKMKIANQRMALAYDNL